MSRLHHGHLRPAAALVRASSKALVAALLGAQLLSGCSAGSATPATTAPASLPSSSPPVTPAPGPDPWRDGLAAFKVRLQGLQGPSGGTTIKEQSDRLSSLRTQLQTSQTAVRNALKDTLAARDRDDSDCSGIARTVDALVARANEANAISAQTVKAADDLKVSSGKFGTDLTAALAEQQRLQDIAANRPIDDPGRPELSLMATTLTGLVQLRSTTTSPIDAAVLEAAPVATSVSAQVASGQRISNNCYRRFSR